MTALLAGGRAYIRSTRSACAGTGARDARSLTSRVVKIDARSLMEPCSHRTCTAAPKGASKCGSRNHSAMWETRSSDPERPKHEVSKHKGRAWGRI